MNLYCAAIYTNQMRATQKQYKSLFPREQQVCDTIPYILDSYHYINKQRFVDEIRLDGGKVFLDSGAFSAHSLGVKIDINEYCHYIHDNKDIIRVDDGDLMASVLDGIGDAQKTYEHQMHMQKMGVRPLPCYHFGEDTRYLDWYVANYSYITIGGMVRQKVPDLIKWLDRIWNDHMLDGAGRPKVKAHAFGITSPVIMERYPWYSVDSSSWMMYALYGNVVLPDLNVIGISSKKATKHEANQHFDTLTVITQDHLRGMIEGEGFSCDQMANNPFSLAAYNIHRYVKWNEALDARIATPGYMHECRAVQGLF